MASVTITSSGSVHYGAAPNNVGRFSGAIEYQSQSSTYGQLFITITNTTDPSARGSIAAFAFGNPGDRITDVSVVYNNTNLDLIGGPTYQGGIDCLDATTNFGNADIGMSIFGNTWNCPGVISVGPNAGLRAGQTGTVVLGLTGTDMGSPTTEDFKAATTSGANPVFFPVHFRWINDNDINDSTTNGDDIISSYVSATKGASIASRIPARVWRRKPPLGSKLNLGHPFTKGMSFAFIFNEGAGTTARNLAYPICISSFPIIAPEYTIGAGCAFVGLNGISTDRSANGNISLGINAGFSGEVTVLTKVFATDYNDSGAASLIGDNTAAGDARQLYVNMAANGLYHISWGGINCVTGGAGSLPTGRPFTLGIRRSGTTGAWSADGFIDGIPRDTGTTTSNPTAASDSMRIGVLGSSNSQRWLGYIEYFYVWTRALSNDEVKALTVAPYSIFAPARSISRGK